MEILPINAADLLQGPEKAGLRQIYTQLEASQDPGQAFYFHKENAHIRRPDFLYQDHRLAHGLVVGLSALDSRHVIRGFARSSQQANTMLPVMAGHGDELVEDPAFVPPGRLLVAMLY